MTKGDVPGVSNGVVCSSEVAVCEPIQHLKSHVFNPCDVLAPKGIDKFRN
jgi:hypothetical protein